MSENLISVTQVAEKLGVSKSTAYTYINKGWLIPDIRLPSGVVKFKESSVEKFIMSFNAKGESNNG